MEGEDALNTVHIESDAGKKGVIQLNGSDIKLKSRGAHILAYAPEWAASMRVTTITSQEDGSIVLADSALPTPTTEEEA